LFDIGIMCYTDFDRVISSFHPQKKYWGDIVVTQNLVYGDFVYICMKLKEWRVLKGHAVVFDTYIMHLI